MLEEILNGQLIADTIGTTKVDMSKKHQAGLLIVDTTGITEEDMYAEEIGALGQHKVREGGEPIQEIEDGTAAGGVTEPGETDEGEIGGEDIDGRNNKLVI